MIFNARSCAFAHTRWTDVKVSRQQCPVSLDVHQSSLADQKIVQSQVVIFKKNCYNPYYRCHGLLPATNFIVLKARVSPFILFDSAASCMHARDPLCIVLEQAVALRRNGHRRPPHGRRHVVTEQVAYANADIPILALGLAVGIESELRRIVLRLEGDSQLGSIRQDFGILFVVDAEGDGILLAEVVENLDMLVVGSARRANAAAAALVAE
jgi:hypothetical protein